MLELLAVENAAQVLCEARRADIGEALDQGLGQINVAMRCICFEERCPRYASGLVAKEAFSLSLSLSPLTKKQSVSTARAGPNKFALSAAVAQDLQSFRAAGDRHGWGAQSCATRSLASRPGVTDK